MISRQLQKDLETSSATISPGTDLLSEFNWQFYVAYYEDLSCLTTYEAAYDHWIACGQAEGRYGSIADFCQRLSLRELNLPQDFNYENYLELNLDLKVAFEKHPYKEIKAIEHFLDLGLQEGRAYISDASTLRVEWEDTPFEIEEQPTVQEGENDEISSVSSQTVLDLAFDWQFYATYYPDICAVDYKTAYAHWQDHGSSEGRYASEADFYQRLSSGKFDLPDSFDYQNYLDLNPDVKEDIAHHPYPHIKAVEHWVAHGKIEKRCSTETEFYEQLGFQELDLPKDFDHNHYLELNPDLEESIGNNKYQAIAHFLQCGRAEGRDYNPSSIKIQVLSEASKIQWNRLKKRVLELSLDESSSEQEYTALIDFGLQMLRYGFSELLWENLLANLLIPLPHPCKTGKTEFLKQELLLLKVIIAFEQALLTSDLVHELESYYRRVTIEGTRQELYKTTLQSLLIWVHDRLFYRGKILSSISPQDVAGSTTIEQQLILLLVHLLIQKYQDPHLAASFLDLLSEKTALNPQLHEQWLRLSIQVNARLGRHYQVLTAASKYFLNQSGTADLYVLAANSALEIPRSSFLKIAESIDRIASWLIQAFQLNPAASYSRKLLNVAIARFAQQATSHTRDVGLKVSVNDALKLRQAALDRLNDLVKVQSHLMGAKLNQDSSLPVRPAFQKVLLVGTRSLPQCYYYRIEQKLMHLRQIGRQADFLDIHELGGLGWQKSLLDVGFIILCRTPATFEVLRFIHYARALGITILYDVDDLIFNEEHFPEPLETYGGTIDRDVHVHLTLDNPFFRTAMNQCDGVIVSTTPLVAQVKQVLSSDLPVWVYPNLMGTELVFLANAELKSHKLKGSEDPSLQTASSVRIVYGSGTKAHKQIFYKVLVPAFSEVLQRYPKVKLLLIGHFDFPELLVPFKNRIVIEPIIPDYSSYLQELKTGHINVAVLEDDVCTDCKSELKWMEAGAFGIPSVVSPTATYRNLLCHGSDVLFASTSAEWAMALSTLVENPELRYQIGENARQKVFQDYTVRTGNQCMRQILEQIGLQSKQRRKKRLLVVNVYFAPQSIGGATRVAETQVRYLAENYSDEFEVYVLCAETEPGHRAPYEVEQYAWGQVLVTKIHAPLRDWSDYQDKSIFDFCLEFYRKYDFDLVHFHCLQILTASVVEAAQVLDIPYVITLHDAWWLSKHQFLVDPDGNLIDSANSYIDADTPEEWARMVERQRHLLDCLHQAKASLAVSESFAEIYRSAGLENVRVNENGLEPFQVLPKQPSQSGRVRVAHIGGMSQHKGFHLFHEALSQGNFQNLEAIVIDHSLAPGESYQEVWGTTPVTFRAKFKQSEINQLYSQIDVLVAPSIWPESYGLVTREALYAGVWVIASDRGAIGIDIMPEINGEIINVVDCIDMMRALEKIDQIHTAYLNGDKKMAPQVFREANAQVLELMEIYQQLLS